MRSNATRIIQFFISLCIKWPLLFSSSNVLPYSVFDIIADAKFNSTLKIINSTYYLIIVQNFLNFPPILRIRSESKPRELPEILKSSRFFIFLYWNCKDTTLINQIIDTKCLRGNAATISQHLSILTSHDLCCYPSRKKLF